VTDIVTRRKLVRRQGRHRGIGPGWLLWPGRYATHSPR